MQNCLRGGFGDSVWQRDVTPQVSMGALAYLVRVLALWGRISQDDIYLSATKRTQSKIIAKQEDMFYFPECCEKHGSRASLIILPTPELI